MNVVSYKYDHERSSMPQFLYVDADYDIDLLPQFVCEIMEKSVQSHPVGLAVIQRMGKAVEDRFKAQHYLDSIFDMIEHS